MIWSLKISRSLITIVPGCQNSEMEGQAMILPCKTGMGEYNGLILIKEAENLIFHPCKSRALSKEFRGNLISLQT